MTAASSDSLYALVAYATPTVGVGNIQPMVRYQWEKVKDNTGTNPWNLDVGLSYLIKGPALRVLATYSYTNLGPARRGSTRPPTPSSSGRRQSSSKVYAPEIGNHQRFIASKTNTVKGRDRSCANH